MGDDDSHSVKMDTMLWTKQYKFTSHLTGLEKDNPPSSESIRKLETLKMKKF